MISDDDIWSLFLLLNYYYSNEQRKFQYVGLIGLMGLIVIFTRLCLYESDIIGHKSQLYIKIPNPKTQGEEVQSKADDGALSLTAALRKKQVIT